MEEEDASLQKQLEEDGEPVKFRRVDGRKAAAKGEIVVDLTEEMEEDHQFWADHAVIARIIGINWSRKEIKSWVEEKWGDRVVIKFLPKSFFVVLFEKGSERDRILSQENWFANLHAMYIQPWIPNFDPLPLAVYSGPLWIRLYNLPIEYWGEVFLEKIGRMLGTVIEVDFNDEEYLCKFARLRIAAVRRVPKSILLRVATGVWRQQVEIEKEIRCCARCGSKFHDQINCKMFVRKARKSFGRPSQKWRPKSIQSKMVTGTTVNFQEANFQSQQLDKESVQNSGGNCVEIEQKAVAIKEIGSGEDPIRQDSLKEGNLSPLGDNHLSRGFSDTEIELNKEFEEEMFLEDGLDNVDPRCINQSANAFLKKAKGGRGRRSNHQKREDRANEKGLVSVLDFMQKARGEGGSLSKK
ncbi:hypothetical protein SUGI_0943280 [Cryptomeria japonica]|nr:hypothetical protein SUGI_0943280 [Cryptomeria japonica]